MKPSAQVQAAIEVFAAVEADIAQGVAAADRRLTEWARGARYAGSKDRRAVADLVYQALRRRGAYLAATESADAPIAARARMLALAALTERETPRAAAAQFGGGRYEPEPLNDAERARLGGLKERLADARLIAHDFPADFRDELARSVAAPAAEIARLRERSAADLRVNLLKTNRTAALARLAEDNVQAAEGPLVETAIRLSAPVTLSRLDMYHDGWIEAQDAASQCAARLARAGAHEIVLDYCAGGGGKSLALAADMGGGAERSLGAYDIDPKRMTDIPRRAALAGAQIALLARKDLRAFADTADLVFVDAPCSGSGAWARNPDAKWATRPARLERLAAAQDDALDGAARCVRPGGRLIYATCSLFAQENQERVAAFLKRRPDFEPADIAAAWRAAEVAGALPEGPSCNASAVLIAPSLHLTDGFFVATLQRSGSVAEI